MKFLYLHICFLLHFSLCLANQPPYKQYAIRDGLVQIQITCLFQDSKGYLWIGTKEGASRFDGSNFANLTFSQNERNANYTIDIDEDTKGHIWFTTWQGLVEYDGQSITRFPRRLSRNARIAIDEADNVWVANTDSLFRFKNGVYENLTNCVELLNGDLFSSIIYDRMRKRILIRTSKYKLLAWDSIGISNLNTEKLPIITLKKNNLDHIFISGKDSIIYEILEDALIKRVKLKAALHDFYTIDNDLTVYFKGNMSKDDPHKRENKNRIYKVFSNKPLEDLNLNFNAVTDLLVDRERNLWIGTEQGLVRVNDAFQHFTTEKGLMPYIWSINEDVKGNIWFMSFGNGIQLFDGHNFTSKNRELSKIFKRKEFYMGSIKGSNGDLFLPTALHIMQYSPDKDRFSIIPETYRQKLPKQDNIDKGAVLSMYEDSTENIFLFGRLGLQVHDGQKEIAFFDGRKSDFQRTSYILTIGKDKEGWYWLGQWKNLTRYNYKTNTFITYSMKDSINHLPNEGVISIFRDHRNNMWFGSSKGLLTYNYTTNKIEKVDIGMTGSIDAMIGIDTSYLMIGIKSGFGFLNLTEYYQSGKAAISHFDYDRDFPLEGVGQNMMFKDSKGDIWISDGISVTKVKPKKLLALSQQTFKTNLLKISFPSFENRNTLDTLPITFTKLPTSLEHFQNSIEIAYRAATFTHPKFIKFEYHLFNTDSSFHRNAITQEKSVEFLNLKPDDYTFTVKAYNPSGVSVDTYETLHFSIIPAWWQLAWVQSFGLLGFLAIIGLGVYGLRSRIKLRQEQKARIEAELRNEQLQVKLNQSRLDALDAQMNPHFIANVLNGLQLLIRRNDARATKYMLKLTNLIRAYLDASKNKEITLEREMSMIELYVSLEKFRFGNFEETIRIEDDVDTNLLIPPMLLQPYVENAINHGLHEKEEGGILNIHIQKKERAIVCFIQDNGIGRAAAEIAKQRDTKSQKSWGTQLIQERIDLFEKLKSQAINIETIDLYGASGEAQGTKVILTIHTNTTFQSPSL